MISQKELWTLDYLKAKKSNGDPLADELMARIIHDHEQDKMNEIWRHLNTNTGVELNALPQDVADYFEKTSVLPDFHDHTKIRKGQEVFMLHGVTMSMILFCKSMPQAYACRDGAKVLVQTGRLTTRHGQKPFVKRLMETSQFVYDVMDEGGLEHGGKGILTAQKIRLIHSSIRCYLKAKNWNDKELGVPINQMYMAGTLMSFSALVIQGLALLDTELTLEEKDAYIHCWSVVGFIMGVDPDLLPHSYDEAEYLGQTIFDNEIKKSEEGKLLTLACIEFMEEMSGNLLHITPRSMIKYLIGPKASFAVGIAQHPLIDLIISWLLRVIFRSKHHLHSKSTPQDKQREKFQMEILQSLITHFNDDKKVEFRIPTALKENWNLV